MNSSEKLKIFIGNHCEPCKEFRELVEEAIKNGTLSADEVEFIDIESDEGFPYVAEYELTLVPSVYRGKQQCEIEYEEEKIKIVCPIKHGSNEEFEI